jgi:hypothetical protein
VKHCEVCGMPVVEGHYLCGPCLTGEAATAGEVLVLVPADKSPKLRKCCPTSRGSGPHAVACAHATPKE